VHYTNVMFTCAVNNELGKTEEGFEPN